MSSNDITYYRERAEIERIRASQAPTDEIAQAHLTLVTMYQNIIERMEREAGSPPETHTAEPSETDTLQ